MPFLALALVASVQGVPAQAVLMSATLDGKPYGKVTYIRQLVPGKGIERTTVLDVEDDGAKYRIEEKRSYATGGTPTTVVRTYTEGERRVVVTIAYSGLKATVTYREGDESDVDELTLTTEGATLTDPSQFWFVNSAPAVKAESKFWEYSIDENGWVERKLKYEGVASLRIGEKNVQAHRISIGADTNFYVDDKGMPYKSVQKTPKGDLVLVRTSPEVSR
jgi:hypothetical protein